jgi:hypothetical protein
MAKATKKSAKGCPQSKQLSVDEFRARHETEFAENEDLLLLQAISSMRSGPLTAPLWSDPKSAALHRAWQESPGHRLMEELRSYWRLRLLAAAKEENSPQAYREILEEWLIKLDVEAPEGVFIPRRRSPGAPQKETTKQIYQTWLANNRPKPAALAVAVYGQAYYGTTNHRKKLRQQCDKAVKRHEKQIATKSAPN